MLFHLEHDYSSIIKHLSGGGVLAYPTESVFGLGCLPDKQSALQSIYQLKGREASKTCLIVAAEVEQINDWITLPFPDNPDTPTTFLLPASSMAPPHLVNEGKIAIRLANYPPLKALCRFSPLISTSANPSGLPAAKTVREVQMYFPNVAVVLGVVQGLAAPSQIINAQTGERLR